MKPTFETFSLEANRSIKVLHYACSAFQDNYGWHFHPEYELSLIVEGYDKCLIGDNIERFSPGDVDQQLRHIPEAQSLQMVLEQAQRDLLQQKEAAANLPSGLDILETQEGLPRLVKLIELLDLLSQTAVTQVLANTSYAADNSLFHSGRLAKVMNYVKTHLAEDLKQSDIAGACGYANLSNFNRRFSELKHLTPTQYRQGCSLEYSLTKAPSR